MWEAKGRRKGHRRFPLLISHLGLRKAHLPVRPRAFLRRLRRHTLRAVSRASPGLPGKAWDLIVDVDDSQLEGRRSFEIPAVSHSHNEVEAVREKVQATETSFADTTTKRREEHSGRSEARGLSSHLLLQRSGVAAFPLWPRGSLPRFSVWSFSSWLSPPLTNFDLKYTL